MESKTVQQLRLIAKERGLKGYSRLRKADLIEFLHKQTKPETGIEETFSDSKHLKYTIKELLFLAKEKKIKGCYLMRKSELMDALEAVEKQEPVKPPERKVKQCIHGKNKQSCKDCFGSRFCEHGRDEYFCKECGGNGICVHWKNKYYCKECEGNGICMHGNNRYYCKECGGNGICKHGKDKRFCKECGGKALCDKHGKRKRSCKECKEDYKEYIEFLNNISSIGSIELSDEDED